MSFNEIVFLSDISMMSHIVSFCAICNIYTESDPFHFVFSSVSKEELVKLIICTLHV